MPAGNPAALAEALGTTLGDRAAAATRVDAAFREYQRAFTADCMTDRYLSVFAELTGRRNPRRRAPIHNPQRPVVLMVGPGVEQTGGIASVIDSLMGGKLRDSVELRRFSTTGLHVLNASRRSRGGFARLLRTPLAVVRHLDMLLRLARTIRRERVDLVHIHTCSFFSFYRSLLDLVVARLLRCKVVLHVHGGQFAEFCRRSNRVGRWAIRHGSESADALVVLSERWRGRLAPFVGRARIEVVANGIDTNSPVARQKRGATERCRFLHLGALTEAKGLSELISAARQLHADSVPFELLLVGPATAAERAHWQRRIQQENLADIVSIREPVRGRRKWELLAATDCLVLASHSEGLPLVILEAGASGLPVIATAVGSVPDLLNAPADVGGDSVCDCAGLLIPAHDVSALSAAMTRLARGAALRDQLGERLQARVRADYGLSRQASLVTQLYERILDRECVLRCDGGRAMPLTNATHTVGQAAATEAQRPAAEPVATHTQR